MGDWCLVRSGRGFDEAGGLQVATGEGKVFVDGPYLQYCG